MHFSHFLKIALDVAEMIRMSDSDIFFRCHQTDKVSLSK